MEKINEESIISLANEIISYFNVDDVEYKSSSRPKPKKVSFIKKLASHWTSDGVMVTEGYSNDLDSIITYLEEKKIDEKEAKNISLACGNASKMIRRYLDIMNFFDMDDMIARKFVNNLKTMEHDLEEILIRVSKEIR